MSGHHSCSSLSAILFVLFVLAVAGCGGVNQPGNGGPLPSVAFAAQPVTIAQGQSTTISWQATNATSVSVSPSVLPPGQTYPLSGSANVSPAQTTTYTATAIDSAGRTASSSVTVTVVAGSSTPTITLSISPQVVGSAQTATITWQSTNATSVAISPAIPTDDPTGLALSGSAVIVPTASTTYTATATGAGGQSATAKATVSILTVSLSAAPSTVTAGQSATLSWNSANATALSLDQGIGAVSGPSGSITVNPAATTTYTITATDGTAIAAAQATVNAPLSVTLTANPVNITPGQQSTLTWNSRGAATLTIDNGVGAVSGAQGSVTVTPAQTTTYNITATDTGGHSATASTTVTVSSNGAGLQTIKHIIFMLQENRSFDNYFSNLGAYAAGRGIANYQINAGYDPNILLPLISGATAHPFHQVTVRTENLTPSWNESHFDMHQQADGTFKMDRFALTTHSVPHNFDPDGLRALGFYNETDLPYYHELAVQFATSDAFHSSLLSNTVPNRQYMFCATSQGRIRPSDLGHDPWTCPTIFSSLLNHNVNFAYYYNDGVLLAQFQDWNTPAIQTKVQRIQNLFNLLASPNADQLLAPVVFIESGSGSSHLDEHPDNNIQTGAAYVKSIIDALMASPAWHDSVFILAYDEGGGLYDHVPPFPVVAPDNIAPQLQPGDLPGDFTLSGFRVPMIIVSPWAKPHFVSHTKRELTSILKLIEARFGLPPLTARDAAADDMTEFFDFVNGPAFLTPPPLPAQPTNGLDDPTKEAPPQ